MERRRQLVIFLRAPLRGAVKRRLARDIGDGAAVDFYRRNAAATIRRLGVDPRWRLILAVTPDRFAPGRAFWDPRHERMPQGPGGLGERMGRVFRQRPPGPVVIIGSDIPGITRDHIAAAFQRLAAHEAVFGPAADGGYWLVGLARRCLAAGPLSLRLFRDVRWSTEHALADTRANLPRGIEAPPLATLDDIDDGAGFDRFTKGKSNEEFDG